MKAYRTSIYLAAFLGFVLLMLFGCEDTTRKSGRSPAMIKIVPEETEEVLSNPGMGWETFHHTADEDKSLPEWIPST